jgi:integrase
MDRPRLWAARVRTRRVRASISTSQRSGDDLEGARRPGATRLRIGELLALRWRALDLDRGTLAVRESVFEGKFQPPKTRKARRTSPLGPNAIAALVAHRERVSAAGPPDLVFATRNGTPMRESKILTDVLQPAAVRTGLGHVTWHQFRHIHSSLLNYLNVPVKIAQEQLATRACRRRSTSTRTSWMRRTGGRSKRWRTECFAQWTHMVPNRRNGAARPYP